MKRTFTKLMAALALLLLIAPPLVGWGQTRTEASLVALTFPDENNADNHVGSYTQTWTAMIDDYSWSIENFNNNNWNNNWTYIKTGSKNNAIIGTINTSAAFPEAITKVELTIYAITASNVNSIKLYTSSNGSSWTEVGTFAKATGVQAVALSSPTAELYYKIAVDCKKSSNGVISISKVEYYHNAGGGQQQTVATPTFELLSGETGPYLVDDDHVMLDCETDGATIYYTIGNDLANPPADPTDESDEYDSNEGIELTETSIIKAIAYVGEDHSSVASQTYYVPSTIAAVRTQGTGSVYTKGIITYIDGNKKNAYIQDPTAAIDVYKSSNNYFQNYAVGDEITVVGSLTTYAGGGNLLEINPTTVTKLSPDNDLPYVEKTIAEINTDAFNALQCQRVKIENAIVQSVSGSNVTIAQGTNTILVYSSSMDVEEGDVITSFYANVGYYNSGLQLINPTDVQIYQGPSIEADPTSLEFSYVSGGSATAKTLTIAGNNLEGNITITLSGSNFAMSEDGNDWTQTSLTIDQTLAIGEIQVRFNSGNTTVGDYEGTITLASENATDVEVNLTGHVTTPTYELALYSSAPGNGTIEFSPASPVPQGATVTLTATPNAGYDFGAWVFYKEGTNDYVVDPSITVENNKFTMPAYNLWIDATFTAKPTNAITCVSSPVAGGELEASPASAYEGQTVTLSYLAETGYDFSSIVITKTSDGSATGITLTASGDDFTFEMPDYAVTATATFLSSTYEGSFVKHTGALIEGDYLLVYNNGAMNNTVTSNKFGVTTVEPSNNIITNPLRTIVWHIAPSAKSGYWTIYNAKSNNYVNGPGSNTNVNLVSDTTNNAGAIWSVTGEYDFRCKANDNESTARYLRQYNGVFGNYASNNGGALTLYKMTTLTERTITFNGNGGEIPTTGEAEYTQTVYDGIAANLTANQFTKESAIFLGWATSTTGEVVYADEAEVTLSADLTLYAKWQQTYTLTLDSPGAEVFVFVNDIDPVEFIDNEAQIPEGATVYASIIPNKCQEFDAISVTYGDSQSVDITDEAPGDPEDLYYSFTMPAAAATLAVTTTQKTLYTLTWNQPSHATLELFAGMGSSTPIVSVAELCEGLYVSVTATIDAGFAFESITVTYGDNQEVEVTTQGTNTFSFEMPAADATLTFTTRAVATYTLVTNDSQIVSGKHYIIASGTTGTVKVMGNQRDSNRGSVEVTVNNSLITETTGIYELVINGPDANGKYTIYDAQYPGYLYAASSSSNQLKTRTNNSNGDSQWTIGIAATTSVATIKAQGNVTRNWMRNNGSLFSCYSSGQSDIYLYLKDNDNDYEYYGTEITYSETTIPTNETITVGAGSIMTVSSGFANDNPEALIIGEGGQLVHPNAVSATMKKDITGYGDDNTVTTGWYTIASSVANATINTATVGTYDLYRYDEENALWLNQELSENSGLFEDFNQGVGYLYANAAGVELQFAGEMVGTGTNITVPLSCSATNANLKGFNLVGNPFTRNLVAGDVNIAGAALTSYYYVAGGSELISAVISDRPIKPGEGFFVQTSEAGNLVLNPTSKGGRGMEKPSYVRIEAGNESHMDQAYIQIGLGNTLNKMTINDNVAHVSVLNDKAEYAVATIEAAQGEMPVNFKASKAGNYTISVNAENTEMNYLHLIDNKTGADIDLLVEPSYSFEAKTSDYASRFRLVFSANEGSNENATETFAYYNGSSWTVSNVGEATLQVVDMMGRVLSSETLSGNANVTLNQAAGIYVLRLINGENVMVQKVVVR